jgi:cell division protease FtsH
MMKTNTNSKPPVWYGFAYSMLKAILDGRKPPLEPETEEQIQAELADFWSMTSAETSVSAEEAEAMVVADDDLLAADSKGHAMPDRQVDILLALTCARVAQMFATPSNVNDLLKPGAMTVLQVADGTDLSRLGDVVRNGMIPKRFRVAQTLQSAPQEPTVHCISLFRGESTETTPKSTIARIEDALALRPGLIVLLSDPMLLPEPLRCVLPEPIRVPSLSQEAILFALTKTHSRTGRIDRRKVLAALPSDKALARLSKVQLFRAFRETSTLRVAAALSKMSAVVTSSDCLAELEGSGALYNVARQVVSDMKAYSEGTLSWSDVPHGLLLTGAPGTGKTFAAKCIAAATGLPFVAATVGSWQSKGHLGDLLRAMIATFDEARAKAPSILFIDELDSIGNRRDADRHGSSYRRQVVNEMLAQLDGVAGCEGVMLIGATNHAEDIDAAILRAGRLDTHVTVSLPDAKGVAAILRHCLSNDTFEDLSSAIIAARGKTPAYIAGAVRSARAAARADRVPLALSHILAALSRGSVPKSPLARRVAVHEAGHAVLAHILGIGEIQELSLKGDGGQILIFRAGWEGTVQAFDDQIAYCLAGRAAEIVVLGDASGGAGGSENSDLALATTLALQLERTMGLGSNGLIWEPVGTLGRTMTEAERQNVARRLEAQEERARSLLIPFKANLELIARSLLDQGSLTMDEVGPLLPNVAELDQQSIFG